MSGLHVEFLVEEPSMERFLLHLLPRLLGSATHEIRVFRGKPDLLRKLPARLKGYAGWFGPDHRVVIVVDRDSDDCRSLKMTLDGHAKGAGLSLASVGSGRKGQAINRIAIEELEAWFLGDIDAIRIAYPRIPQSLGQRRIYRDPDAISGTAEALERALNKAGYHAGGLPKIAFADAVTPHLDLEGNRSVSFQHFISAVRHLVETAA